MTLRENVRSVTKHIICVVKQIKHADKAIMFAAKEIIVVDE